MTTNFKQDNPGCGDDDCCGCTEPPSCTLNGSVVGSNIVLTWTVSGVGITAAGITNDDTDSYPLTVPPYSGTLSVPKATCRQWTLTVVNDCGSSTCTFNETNCTVEYLRTVACETCADSDYPSALITPRQAKISISGVTTGYNNPSPNYYNCSAPSTSTRFFSEPNPAAIYLTDPNCEINAMAANTSFFNSDFTLDPCTDIWLYDCRFICSTLYTGFFVMPYPSNDYFEWNVLHLYYQPGVGAGTWNIGAELFSWVAYYQRAASPGSICTSVGSPFGGPPVNNNTQKLLQAPSTPGIYGWLSYRTKGMVFSFNAGTRPGYYYDPAYCDAECNHDVSLAKCLQTDDIMSTPTSYYSTTCPNEKALNVNVATATVTIL